jgi:hypothetical protein
MDIRLFNNLPDTIKMVDNYKTLKQDQKEGRREEDQE